MTDLQTAVTKFAEELEVTGVSAGVLLGGEQQSGERQAEQFGFHGVTNVENPLPVDGATVFQFGSTGKTFTATAMLRLVEAGKVDLDAPVRTYLPALELKDSDVAAQVTVLHLFHHT